MPKKDPRVDAYIRSAAPFAQPILKHLRRLVHEAAPDIEETIKWGMPSFMADGIVCGMAAFKAHATFGFWNSEGIEQALGLKVGSIKQDAMGQFGRITAISDLPSATVLKKLVKAAVELDRAGAKPAWRARQKPRPALPM